MCPFHLTPAGAGVGVGVEVGVTDTAPGSETPGGNGFVREAMKAPIPAHTAKTATHTVTLSVRRIEQP